MVPLPLRLELSDCALVGRLPPALGSLARLRELRLNHNQLSGELPASLLRMPRLLHLSLCKNRLQGAWPRGLCAARNTRAHRSHHTREFDARARANRHRAPARSSSRHRARSSAVVVRRSVSPPPSSPLGRSVSAAPLVAIVSCAVLRRGRWWSSSRSPRGLTVTARAVRETHVSGSSHENACDWFIVSFSLFSGEALPLPNPPRARSLVLAYNSNDHATVSPTCVCATM